MVIQNRIICDFVTQRCASLLLLVNNMHHKTTLSDIARMVIDRIEYSHVSSKDIIKSSLNTPLNNHPCLHILRLGVLRQYFDRNVADYLAQK